MSSIAKILIVDDNPKYLKDVLPSYGYEVEVATDGMQAIKVLGNPQKHFDLMILDIVMPNMDGWATLKRVREDEGKKSMPIIMLTSMDKEQQQVSGLKFGADDYIVKPFALPNLLARIEALLRRSKWNSKTNPICIPFASDEPVDALTIREAEVLSLVAQGANNLEIAEKLFVKEVTVKTHLNNIFKKLNVANRTQAVLLAMQLKII